MILPHQGEQKGGVRLRCGLVIVVVVLLGPVEVLNWSPAPLPPASDEPFCLSG